MIKSRQVLLGCLSLVACVAAGCRAAPPDGKSLVKLQLISEAGSLTPGTTVNLGLHFVIAPGWHIYWNGLNDTGFPPSVEITAPDGYVVGESRWPAPARHISPGDLLDHVYEREALIIVPVTVPKDAKPGTSVRLEAASKWLVCEDACIPGDGKSSLDLTIATAPKPSTTAPLFAAATARMPGPPPADGSLRLSVHDGEFVAAAPAAARLRFFPSANCASLHGLISRGDAKGDRLAIRLEDPSPQQRIRGVLEVVPPPGAGATQPPSRFYTIDLPAAPGTPESAQPQEQPPGPSPGAKHD